MTAEVVDLDKRVTLIESKMIEHGIILTKQADSLHSIEMDIHKISLSLASAKGWIVAILGVGAIASTAINWAIQLMNK